MTAISSALHIVPQGHALKALEDDYKKMIEDDVLVSKAVSFDDLMKACLQIQDHVNNARDGNAKYL